MADEIENLFKEVDTSNDGKISVKELGKMFKKLGIRLTVKEVRKLIFDFDKDGSKDIDCSEFRELIKNVMAVDEIYKEAYEAFKVFDKDGSNIITIDEVKEACKHLKGDKITEEEINKLILKMDIDGNGVIDFDEFAKAYAIGL